MNYQRIYDAIISKARSENRKKGNGIYYESHHIIPRCLNGNDDKENKVLLTAKEHYVCHKLLTYIYKGNRQLVCAFYYMTYKTKNNKYNKSARDYVYARELISLTPMANETIEKIRKAAIGRKHSKVARKNMSIAQQKRFENIEERKKFSRPGKKNGMYGISAYDLWIQQYGINGARKRKRKANEKRKRNWELKRFNKLLGLND